MALLGATHPALDGPTTVVVGRQYRPARASKRTFGLLCNRLCAVLGRATQPRDGATAGHWPIISSQFSRLSARKLAFGAVDPGSAAARSGLMHEKGFPSFLLAAARLSPPLRTQRQFEGGALKLLASPETA
jgi:hypothetical protein